jgi:hypothetical protein
MNFPSKTGSGRAVINGKVQDITWAPNPHSSYTTDVTAGGHTFEITDYEDRMDFLCRPNDSGDEYYNTMVLLSPDESDPPIPTKADLTSHMMTAMQPIMAAVAADQVHADDMKWAMVLFRHPECVLRAAQKHGSVLAGMQAIAKHITSSSMATIL